MKTTHMMRLATFIIASLALTPVFAPVAQGQEVRRAISLNQGDRQQRESFDAERRSIDAESRRLKAEADRIQRALRELDPWPSSPQKFATGYRLLAQLDENTQKTNRLADRVERLTARIEREAMFEVPTSNSWSVAPALTSPPSKNDCLIVAT